MAGLQVRVRALTIGEMMELTRAAESAPRLDDGTIDGSGVSGSDLEQMFRLLADALLSWNLESESLTEEGVFEPVPATFEGIITQEADFMMDIVHAWMDAGAGVEPGLKDGSNSGGTSPVLSIPMDVLSPSLSS